MLSVLSLLAAAGCERDSLISTNNTIRYDVALTDIATKGDLVNNNDNGDYSDIALALSTFRAAAYNGTSPVFTTAGLDPANVETVSFASGSWTMPHTYYWPQKTSLTFFAYANLPAEGSSVAITSAGQTLTHEMVSAVADQKDILLGYYQGRGVNGNTAEIRFWHPLTSVFFKAGDLGGEIVTDITLSGLATSGTVTMDADGIIGTWQDVDDYTAESSQGNSEGLDVNATTGVIGDPFILIPQDLTENGVALTVTCKSGLTLKTTISSGTWQAGKTNTYTIGYVEPSSYTFTLEGGETSGSQTFSNTTYTGTETITIVSEKENGSGTVTPVSWLIKSVQVGSEPAQEINDASFDIDVLSGEITSEGKLKLATPKRINQNKGGHEYWIGDNGNWSPVDWSSTKATDSNPLDLSKFNFKEETTDNPMTTANCYIVRHAGTYMIPLVYGNGVVDGNENTQSYYPDETGGTNRLDRFINHKGDGIQSAFIENNTGCKAADCCIVWQDEAFVIKNLEIVGSEAGTYTKDNVRYLQFTVDPSTICQNNAVIAVKDEAGQIIWSWLIWTTNDPTLRGDPYEVSNTHGNFSFFPMNSVGWMDETEYPGRDDVVITIEQSETGETIEITVEQPEVSEPAHGNYYQFGRKDPMCRKDLPVSDGFDKGGVGKVDLKTAIMNPGIFYNYGGSGNSNWCSSTYDNLWSGKLSTRVDTYKINDLPALTKTVYDPSPAGYQTPTQYAFYGVPAFTAQGYRSRISGNFSGFVQNFYWSAIPVSDSDGLLKKEAIIDCSCRAHGMPVRPVLEKNPGE